MHRRIIGLVERQRLARVGNSAPRDRDYYSLGVAFDRDRMIRAGDFDRLRLDLDILLHRVSPFCRVPQDYVADLPPSTKST